MTSEPRPPARLTAAHPWRSLIDPDHLPGPPTTPLRTTWRLGVSDLLRASAPLPDGVARLSRPIDRLGSIELSPDHLRLNGDTSRWRDVVELRVAPPVDVLTSAAIEAELARLARVLPPLPGRAWVVSKVSRIVIGLAVGVLEAATPDEAAATVAATDPIPTRIVTRARLGRTGEQPVGLFAGLLCAAMPAVPAAIANTAQERGARIVDAGPSAGRRHADQVAETLRRLRRRASELGD